jgi:hypothetical protein
MTSKGRSILAEIEAVERLLKADGDAEIKSEAVELADKESKVVEESTDKSIPVEGEETLGQNAKANANWPLEARKKFAAKLLHLASAIIADDDEDEDDEEKGEKEE